MLLSASKLKNGKSMNKEKIKKLAISLGLWILVIWLLYPLITLDSMKKFNLNPYLFRSTIGILIMIIMLGRNVFDLFMPQAYSQKAPASKTLFLVLYSFVMAGIIIFMISRLIKIYIGSVGTEVAF